MVPSAARAEREEREMATAVLAPIVLDERGVAYIEGTTTKVIEVVLNKEWSGDTAEELQQNMPHLTLAQIYGALAYYHANKEALDADIQRRAEIVDRLRKEAGESPVAKRLRAEGKLT